MTALHRLRESPGRMALALLACEAAAALVLAAAGAEQRLAARRDMSVVPKLASELRLTDLSLWSSASYCRHLSQADLFAAHAEHPAAPDHFPDGSIAGPPLPALHDRPSTGWRAMP